MYLSSQKDLHSESLELTSCVFLNKLLKVAEPLLPHLEASVNSSFIEML